MRFKLELEERLGRAVVAELLRLVSIGHIGRRQVMEMSYQHNMNVNTVYNQSHDKEVNIVLTMERMLDRWYEFTVCSLSQSEAQSKLQEILRESHCTATLWWMKSENFVRLTPSTKIEDHSEVASTLNVDLFIKILFPRLSTTRSGSDPVRSGAGL